MLTLSQNSIKKSFSFSKILRNYVSIRYGTSQASESINLDGKYYTHSLDNPGPPLLLSHNIRSLPMSPSVRINEIQQDLVQQGRKVYRMGFGQSPFPVPPCMLNNLRYYTENIDYIHQNMNYLSFQGLPELRNSVADCFNTLNNFDEFKGSNVMIGPGSKELIFLLQLAYYGELLVPTPSWVSYTPQAKILGLPYKWLNTTLENDYKLTPEVLYNELASDMYKPRILILNYPNNPCGNSYTADELKELANICRQQRIIVLSDEIYAPLMHENTDGEINAFKSIYNYYPEGTIILTGISKWAGSGGWRQGSFLFPDNMKWLLNSMIDISSHTFKSVSLPIQYGTIPAFRDHFGPEMTEYFKIQRRIFGGLGYYGHKILSEVCNINQPVGSFYLFPDFTKTKNVDKMIESYKKQNPSITNYTNRDFAFQLIKETGISSLGGSVFGRDQHELTIKLSIVDFMGQDCIDNKDELFKIKNIQDKEMESFLRKYTPNVMEAYDVLNDYFKSL